MNSFNVVDFHKEWVEMGLIEIDDFLINCLLNPSWMRIQTLSKPIKEKLVKHYTNHIDGFISLHNGEHIKEQFSSAINFINNQNFDHLLPECYFRLKEIDDIRNENFAEIFPELKEIYE